MAKSPHGLTITVSEDGSLERDALAQTLALLQATEVPSLEKAVITIEQFSLSQAITTMKALADVLRDRPQGIKVKIKVVSEEEMEEVEAPAATPMERLMGTNLAQRAEKVEIGPFRRFLDEENERGDDEAAVA